VAGRRRARGNRRAPRWPRSRPGVDVQPVVARSRLGAISASGSGRYSHSMPGSPSSSASGPAPKEGAPEGVSRSRVRPMRKRPAPACAISARSAGVVHEPARGVGHQARRRCRRRSCV
jgi:hypothetical protein